MPDTTTACKKGRTGSVTAAFANKNVGTSKTVTFAGFALTGADASNYNLIQPTTTADISAEAITVTAHTNTKGYDGGTSAAATPDVTSGAIQTGDTANFAEHYATKTVGTSKTLIPTGTVTDGNSGSNYAVTLQNSSTGVITAQDVTGMDLSGTELVVLGVLDHHHGVADQQLRVDERAVGHVIALAQLGGAERGLVELDPRRAASFHRHAHRADLWP